MPADYSGRRYPAELFPVGGPGTAAKGKRMGRGSEPGASCPEARHGADCSSRFSVRMARECLKASAVRALGHHRKQPVRRSYSRAPT